MQNSANIKKFHFEIQQNRFQCKTLKMNGKVHRDIWHVYKKFIVMFYMALLKYQAIYYLIIAIWMNKRINTNLKKFMLQ